MKILEGEKTGKRKEMFEEIMDYPKLNKNTKPQIQ